MIVFSIITTFFGTYLPASDLNKYSISNIVKGI